MRRIELDATPSGGAPAVAILMAVHAGADPAEFEEAVLSLRTQTFPRLRILLYCDGSLSPAHEEVLVRHLRLQQGADCIVRGARPVGLPTALNHLIDLALGDPSIEFLARMDADDISMPERIARQVEFLQAKPNVTVAGTWVIEFFSQGVPQFYKRLPHDPAEVSRFMLYRSPLAHPSVMFRRGVFERGHRYDTRLLIMQDYDLWSRLILAGEVISNVTEYLLWFRMAPGFFERRGGLTRAWGEVRLRFHYARRSRQLGLQQMLKLGALFMIRLMPSTLKRLAYQHLRR